MSLPIYEKDFDDTLIDGHGEPLACQGCSDENHFVAAVHVVAISGKQAHDGHRLYCDNCHNAYLTGVQHGRRHEAACHGVPLTRSSSQEEPRKHVKAKRVRSRRT